MNDNMTAAKPQYKVQYAPMGARRPLRIICIGAGYSGLMMTIIYEQKMQGRNIDFKVYEMNEDLGGTWLVNRYPGCSCDIPGHNYAYSFAPNPDWPNYYATSPQIHDYMKGVSQKYGCDKYLTYRHKVTNAIWDETATKWRLKVVNLNSEVEFDDDCDIFINAGGLLNNWRWPSIPGIETYKGKLMHSAHWDSSYDFKGKNIAIIGIGSSGIQILPELSNVAKQTTCFVRSETWISPKGIIQPADGGPKVDEHSNYDEEELKRFREDPEYLLRHRRDLANRRIGEFKAAMAGEEEQRVISAQFRASMLERLGSSEKGKEIAKWLLPDFPVGCRRLTPGPGFLEALLQDNVDAIWNNVGAIDATGIVTKDGKHLEFDAICCATGFDTTYRPRFPIIGRNGVNLAQKWDQFEPECYFGTTVPDFPNYFSFLGPNSPISNGSLVQAIQATGVYIYKCVEKMQTEGIQSMEVSEQAAKDYNEHTQAFLKTTVWAGDCSSWYKRGTRDGRIVAIYAGSAFHFVESLRRPRWEDYRFEYVAGKGANRFTYLGNGFTRREARNGDVGDTQTLTFDDYWDIMELPDTYE